MGIKTYFKRWYKYLVEYVEHLFHETPEASFFWDPRVK